MLQKGATQELEAERPVNIIFFFLFIQLVVAWFAKPCVDTDTYFLERDSTLCQGTGIDRIGPFWSLGLRIARLTFV